jgi:zinc transport system ATP-binding protein
MNNILEVKNLNVSFNDHKIIDNLSLNVARDTTVAIVGSNGSGKTVFFKCLLDLIKYEGSVKWAEDTRIGYVPQKLAVSKDLPITVSEFLHLKEDSDEKILKVLSEVGFHEHVESSKHFHSDTRVLKSKLSSLSGGELQRILMANALLGDPNVLLLDEPTAGVDLEGEKTFYELFKMLKDDRDLTIIFISHDSEAVKKYADTVLKMEHNH